MSGTTNVYIGNDSEYWIAIATNHSVDDKYDKDKDNKVEWRRGTG